MSDGGRSARIEVRGVVRSYGGARVVDDVSFAVEPGSFAALVGPSGSGKTTLLNLIGGLDRPDAGSVRVGSAEVSALGAAARALFRKRSIGFVFQSYNLIDVLTAQENVELPLALLGIASRERAERARRWLDELGVAHRAAARPTELSGGEQQRVAVARALVKEPPIVLGDEPTANLDHTTGLALLDTMAALNQRHGTTFLVATHDPRVVERTSTRYVLSDGRLVSGPQAS
ncbi:MAG: ABC transporter ATP-binding protein [bacterium]